VASDDKETSDRLPRRVERALAEARAAAKADYARKEGSWLAVIPLMVGALVLLLMMPRATAPESVPLPRVDARALERIERADDARAAAAESERLPGYVLAIGSALRALNAAEVRGADELTRLDARRRLQAAVRDVPKRGSKPAENAEAANVEADLLSLRALQARRFVAAVSRWESTGETNDDLVELGGGFIQRADEAGWVVGRRVLMEDRLKRIAFKLVWNTLVGVDGMRAFDLSLDEQRALHSFYIENPRAPETSRVSLAVDRRNASTPEACARVAMEERRQRELWRAEKIKKLGSLDATYPTAYALGVVYYRAGRFDLATEAFATYAAAHQDGPYALRARNHLKAALAGRASF
jgi:hypothetical protein